MELAMKKRIFSVKLFSLSCNDNHPSTFQIDDGSNNKVPNFERYFLDKESKQEITESFKFYRDKEILIRVPDPETNPAVVTLTEED